MALALLSAAGAHDCVPEKRWVETRPDGSVFLSRCLFDAAADPEGKACLSAVDTRPWNEDSLVAEIAARAARRSRAALVRIDSVRSSHRDSAFVVGGEVFVERHMREDVFVTVDEVIKGAEAAGPVLFREAWNMGNIVKGVEYASFWPGRGQRFLALYDSGARLSELVRPATECAEELSGYRLDGDRVRVSGEGAAEGLSAPLAKVKAALAATLRARPAVGAARKPASAGLRAVRAGAGTPGVDLKGRRVAGGPRSLGLVAPAGRMPADR